MTSAPVTPAHHPREERRWFRRFFTPFRLASYLLVFFFLGHTLGGMLGQKSLGPASDVVFELMKTTHFTFNGSDSTWYGFWFGFGLMASVFLAFCAFLCWKLDDPRLWPSVAPVAWALAVAQALTAYLSFRYFFVGPGVFATLATLCIIAGALRRRTVAA
jgi:hypothetical protein